MLQLRQRSRLKRKQRLRLLLKLRLTQKHGKRLELNNMLVVMRMPKQELRQPLLSQSKPKILQSDDYLLY